MIALLFLLLQNPLILRDQTLRQIQIPGRIYPSHFNHGDGLADHHFIVWKGGRAAEHALIQAEVPDAEILEALLELGGTAGDNLTSGAWLQRYNPLSEEPDKHVEGTRVEVTVSWSGQSHEVTGLLTDQAGQAFLFRLGGHAKLIPLWRSGCVVCLESCPGGRISNSTYTMRDLAKGRVHFVLKGQLPADGTPVTLTLKLLP